MKSRITLVGRCSDIAEESRQFRIRSLSGDIEDCCSFKGVNTIGDLRDLLSAKIKKPKEILLIVDKEEGIIFNDETEIKTFKVISSELMIGNKDRTTETGDDKVVVNDVISNRRLTGGKCQMSCGDWTAPNTLFDWTKEKLPGALTKGLPCPKCGKMWDVDELIKRCKMSPDERLFFKSVEIIIKQNAELVK